MLLLVASAIFASAVSEDPITRERLAMFSAEDDGNYLAISCKPGSKSININVIPDRYYGHGPGIGLFGPTAASRFSGQSKAEYDKWYFQDQHISYSPSPFTMVNDTASFLDQLAKDHEFNFRFQTPPSNVRTITIRYEVDVPELQAFIAKCGPVKVIERLRSMDSPAAPR